MNILLCNDDGIESLGLKILAKKLSEKNRVLVVAPDGNRSGFSHSLSVSNSIKILKIDNFGVENCMAYSVSGTPVDCVKVAHLLFSDFNVDCVVAGINKGHNLGSDILYSGTVCAAFEAVFFNKPAFAFSAFSHNDSDFTLFANYAEEIIDKLLPYTDKRGVWNVNFPDNGVVIKGIRFAKLCNFVYRDSYELVGDGEYILRGEVVDKKENPSNSDVSLVLEGYITITPLIYDKTDKKKIIELKEKCIEW